MAISTPFGTPYYSGSNVSTEIPNKFHVALAGRGFMLDLESELFNHETIDALRPQSDTSDEPGEQSLNPQGLFRRSQDSWHLGAGQTFLDRSTSKRTRFRQSKGIDVWTPHRMGLLNDTVNKRSSAFSNLGGGPVGTYAYFVDGNEIYTSQDLTAGSPAYVATNVQAGEGASSVQSFASDGYNVWAVVADGIHTSTRGSTTWTHYGNSPAAGAYYLVAFVKGRLMAADRQFVYNIIAGGAAPAALNPSFANSDFRWTAFAEGPAFIYMAGYAGDKSVIYKTAVKADGTALDPPTVAGELPSGGAETIRSLKGTAGMLVIGTDTTIRLATINSDGNLVIGSPIVTGKPVRAIETQKQFAHFGWDNYDSVSTGLGRLDLSTDNGDSNVPLPAYASDLMATAQGAVTTVFTFQGRRVFGVSGIGFFVEDTNLVPQGTLDTGYMGFNLPEKKMAEQLDVRLEPTTNNLTVGTTRTYIAVDRGSLQSIGIVVAGSTIAADAYVVGQLLGEVFEIRQELNRDSANTAIGPAIERHTLLVNPLTDAGYFIDAPLVIADAYELEGSEIPRDPQDDLLFIKNLKATKSHVAWQEWGGTYPVSVQKIKWMPKKPTERTDRSAFVGTCLVRMKTATS